MKKLSIITITYNDLLNLKSTVDSVLIQLNEQIEYWIIDGASKDGTYDYLCHLKDVNWISESDSGIYDAMNKGINLAKGEWILFLNAGDLLLHDVLNKLLPELKNEHDCYFGDIIQIIPYMEEKYYIPELANADIQKIRKGMICSHQAFLCKRYELIEIGGFDTCFYS